MSCVPSVLKLEEDMAVRKFWDLYFFLIFVQLCSHSWSLSYDVGKIYKYRYETTVALNEVQAQSSKPSKDVGYKITTEFDVMPVFQAHGTQLLKVQFTSAAVSSISRESLKGDLVKLLKYPMYFELSGGVVGKVYGAEVESVFYKNVKKGIISLFQLQETEGQRDEVDISGECSAYYSVSGNHITKTKHSCYNLEISGQFSNANKMFGVSVDTTSITDYEVSDGLIKSATSVQKSTAVVNARSSLNAMVEAIQKLDYVQSSHNSETITAGTVEEAVDSLDKVAGYAHSTMLLPSSTEIQDCKEHCDKPLYVLKKLKDDLSKDNLSKISSAKAFLKMLKTFRNAGKITIEEVLTDSDSYYIVPQLIDIAAAAQTPAAHQALMQLVQFDHASAIEYPERMLLAAAFSTHPGEYFLRNILDWVKKDVPNDSLRQSLSLGMGALVYTYCQVNTQCTSEEVIVDYIKFVGEKLNSCEDEECKLTQLRSMGNSGQSYFLPLLLNLAEQAETASVSLLAIQSLRRMPKEAIVEQAVPVLSRIFHQNKRTYDSSVRLAAIDVVLQSQPTTAELRNVLLSAISDQKEFEVSTFVIKRLADLAQSNLYIRSSLKAVLSNTLINNYNLFAQKGKSSAFSSNLADTTDFNSTYGLYQENTKTGVMKKSAMIVDLVGKIAKQPLLTFGIYAEGLEALLGDAQEGEESQDATAGLTLTLMDIMLRPVEFFRGTSGLMAAVWNAPSEPVSALQANLLLQDHSQKVHLSNGLVVDVSTLGVASIDLSGSISISLWYKNSHSVITNSGALVIEGAMSLDSEVLKGGVQFAAESESFIDFQTDVDFAEMPLKMCLQMKRPPVVYKQQTQKYEKSRFLKKSYRSTIKRTSNTPPQSYFINEKNSMMCTIMDPDQ